MKGFAKIFEAIIASIILLASLTFFFTPNLQKSEWDSAHLQVLAEDALESAYLNGTLTRYAKTDNTTELNAFLSDMLPKTVDFSIEVRGIPGSVIYIACVDCSQANIDDLSAILNPRDFSYKMKNASMRIEPLALATQSIPEDTNILFFFDKTKISTHQTKINEFLEKGWGVFLLSDLAEGDLQNSTISIIFDLSWSGSATNLPGRFDEVSDPGKAAHYVARYYANVSTRHLQNVQFDTFQVFSPTGVNAANDKKNIVKTDNNRAYARANEAGRGRTLWMANYARTDHNDGLTRAVDNLTKASVMWVSGERSKLDLVKKAPAPVHIKSSIFVYDEDSYIVELTIWRIFF